MALTGKNLKAKKAKKVGLVDTVVNPLGPGLEPSDSATLKYMDKIAVGIASDLANGKMVRIFVDEFSSNSDELSQFLSVWFIGPKS